VCWDQWYPEGARLTALNERRRMSCFYPTAIGVASGQRRRNSEQRQHDAWAPPSSARHAQSQMGVICWPLVNRAWDMRMATFAATLRQPGQGLEFLGRIFPVRSIRASTRGSVAPTKRRDPGRRDQSEGPWKKCGRKTGRSYADRRIDSYGNITHRVH